MATLRDDVSAVPNPDSGGDGSKSALVDADCLLSNGNLRRRITHVFPFCLRSTRQCCDSDWKNGERRDAVRPALRSAQYRSFSPSKATLLETVMSARCSLMYSLLGHILDEQGIKM